MNYATFTQATLNTPVHLFPDNIVGAFTAPDQKVTCIIIVGGSSIPVTDTLEDAVNKISNAKNAVPATTISEGGK